MSEYENFVVYTVYISTHLLCSVLQLIYVSDIYNIHIEDDVCDSDSELCCSEFFARNHCAPSGYDVLSEMCGVHSLCTADCALIAR